MENEEKLKLIIEKLQKIEELSCKILTISCKECKNENSDLRLMAQTANREAFNIKQITNQIKGILINYN